MSQWRLQIAILMQPVICQQGKDELFFVDADIHLSTLELVGKVSRMKMLVLEKFEFQFGRLLTLLSP